LVFDQEPAPEPAPNRRPPWALVLAGLAGLAVGAVVVGGIWLSNGTGRTVDTRPITAPAKVGDFVQFDQLDLLKKPTSASQADRDRQRMQESTKLLSQSHGGAGALFAHYATQELETQVIVQIYRDRSPFPLFVPYIEPSEIGSTLTQTAEQFGEVSCIVVNDPSASKASSQIKGAKYAPRCSRSSDVLTVEVTPNGDLQEPAEVAKLVDEIWASVS
jgi:hypothetical protein